MTGAELEAMLERALSKHSERIVEKAAEVGARKALAAVGLHDESAAGDVKDLRELLASMRSAKRAARVIGGVLGAGWKLSWSQAVKIATTIGLLWLLYRLGIKPHWADLP